MKDKDKRIIRATCPLCGLTQRLPPPGPGRIHCAQCNEELPGGSGSSRAWVLSVTAAALLLYVPANVLPVLRITYLGAYSENTIIEGAEGLYRSGMWPLAIIVFLASVMVPLVKLLGLVYLTLPPPGWDARRRTALHRLLVLIGPWAMLDVFLVAILVALLKLGDLVTVLPGPGLWAFTGVVVLTLIASQGFDARWLWLERDHG